MTYYRDRRNERRQAARRKQNRNTIHLLTAPMYCRHCGKPLELKANRRGRKKEYCTTSCSYKEARKRKLHLVVSYDLNQTASPIGIGQELQMNTQKNSKTKTAIVVKRQPAVSLMTRAASVVEGALRDMALAITASQDKPGQLAQAYHVIDKLWLKVVEDQKKQAREWLLALVDQHGEKSPDNPHTLSMDTESGGDNYRLKKVEAWSTKPDMGKLSELLAEKKLKVESACDAVISHVPNMDKIQALIDAGKLTQEEVEACKKITSTQLKVEKL